MEKPAQTDHPVLELITRRWSPHAFDPRPVPEDVLARIFEAARWAASSYNEQPWLYFLAVHERNPQLFEKLVSVIVPQNGWSFKAPVLALSVAKMSFSHNGSPNRVAVHDVGMASENMVLQATNEGLFVHQMAGFDVARARQVLELPEGYEPVAMIALGYPGDPDSLNEGMKARELAPRSRKKVEEFVKRDIWK